MEFIFSLSLDRASLMNATQSNDLSGTSSVIDDLPWCSNVDGTVAPISIHLVVGLDSLPIHHVLEVPAYEDDGSTQSGERDVNRVRSSPARHADCPCFDVGLCERLGLAQVSYDLLVRFRNLVQDCPDPAWSAFKLPQGQVGQYERRPT